MPASINPSFQKALLFAVTILSALRGVRFGFDPVHPVPVITARRSGIRPDTGHLADFVRIRGIAVEDSLPPALPADLQVIIMF